MKISLRSASGCRSVWPVVLAVSAVANTALYASDCCPPPTGLVSWWKGETDAKDSAGTNNGTASASFVSGLVGQCFSFNGQDQSIQIPNSASLNPPSAMTLEGWVKPGTLPGDVVSIVTKENVLSGVQYQITLAPVSGHWLFRPLISVPAGYVFSDSTTSVQGGTWYHVAMTHDGSWLRVYVNGQLESSAAATGSIVTGTEPLAIGSERDGWFFNGLVDELSLYSRALSDAEVQAIYHAGAAGKCDTPVPPQILTHPQDQVVLVGDIADFNVVATGTPPLCYQWQSNGTNRIGATTTALTLTNVKAEDAGTYSVIVSNQWGTQVSSNATLTVNPLPPCTPLVSGAAAWWSGGGDAVDQIGANNGGLFNGVTFVNGKVGACFSFDGINQFVEVPSTPALNPSSAMTLEAWVNVSAFPSGGIVSIFTKENQFTGVQYQLGLAKTGSRWCFQPLIDVPSGYVYLQSSNSVQSGVWYHVAMTYDGAALSLYVNGILDGATAASGLLVTGPQPLDIGSERGGWCFNGLVDELTLYSRALSAQECQAIYQAGSGGKCFSPVPPFFGQQPLNQSVTVGQTVAFTAGVSGTPPFAYQWSFNADEIAGATASSLVLTNVQFSQAGDYSVVVSNSAGSMVSSNAHLTVNFPPATIRVVNTPAEGGRVVSVPVALVANGNENALGFSLNFAVNRLTFQDVSLGADAAGGALLVNSNALAQGRVGIAVSLPAGNTFAAGTQQILFVNFTVAVLTGPATTTIAFGDVPTLRELSDATANLLPASYTSGTITISRSMFEGDVSPRPNGDGAVTITDWVLVGRYAAVLDSPTNTSEFQRADCAPRSSFGDGAITVADWVQTGRFAAGLDSLLLAGGPGPGGPLAAGKAFRKDFARKLKVADKVLAEGQTGTFSVSLESQGDENAIGGSINFDPSTVTFASATLGPDATGASLNFNDSQSSTGRVAFVMALPTGTHFSPGTRDVLRISFKATPTASGQHAISLADQPVVRQVVDVTATALSCDYIDGSVTVYPPPTLQIQPFGESVTLTWPIWATNFVLQAAASLPPGMGGWTNISPPLQLTNGEASASIPRTPAARYYRLIQGP